MEILRSFQEGQAKVEMDLKARLVAMDNERQQQVTAFRQARKVDESKLQVQVAAFRGQNDDLKSKNARLVEENRRILQGVKIYADAATKFLEAGVCSSAPIVVDAPSTERAPPLARQIPAQSAPVPTTVVPTRPASEDERAFWLKVGTRRA